MIVIRLSRSALRTFAANCRYLRMYARYMLYTATVDAYNFYKFLYNLYHLA